MHWFFKLIFLSTITVVFSSNRLMAQMPSGPTLTHLVRTVSAECEFKWACLVGVAETIRNRVKAPGFPRNYAEATKFTYRKGKKQKHCYYQTYGGNKEPYHLAKPGTKRFAIALRAVREAIVGGSDTVHGATHNWGPRCGCAEGAKIEASDRGIHIASVLAVKQGEVFYTKKLRKKKLTTSRELFDVSVLATQLLDGG